MNHDRRRRISAVADQIAAALETLEAARGDLGSIRDEEQEAFDNLPESLQDSDRGQTSQQAIDLLDEVYSAIDDFIDASPTTALEDAQA